MSAYSFYIDVSKGQLLTGLNNTAVLAPSSLNFYVGDGGVIFQVYLMTPLQTTDPSIFPYSIIPTTGLSLAVYLDDGQFETDTIYSQQVNWSTDPNSQYFYANMPFNTTALENFLGSAISCAPYLHIGYYQNGLPTTVFLEQITMFAGIPNNLTSVPAGLTPLSQQAADQRYVLQKGNAGQGFILTSPLGKEILVQAVDNGDGTASFQASPIN